MIGFLWRLLSPPLAALLPLAAPFSPKLAALLRWRRECRLDIAEARRLRERIPRFWVHAASAGELEQALPLVDGLRERHPGCAVLLTLGSPSARAAGERVGTADAVLPLPPDTPRAMGELLDAFAPDAVLPVKWDLWPNLLTDARRRGVPVVLLGGVLGAESRRAVWLARRVAKMLHGALAGVGAASEEDARRFLALGADPVRVTGDTRFDRVALRREERRPLPLVATDTEREHCLVAGSSWPQEEDMLLAAFARLRDQWPELRLLVVPHEPRESALQHLEREARAAGLPLWRLSQRAELGAGGICVVDRLGILPELYSLGGLAMVGGGFGEGVHSVLEPASHGLPVMMGPRIGRADEARRLAAAGAGFIVTSGEELHARWHSLLADPAARAEAGRRARGFVASGLGATDRNLDFLAEILAAGGSDGP